MTTLNVTLSAALQGELNVQGVWAYAVYFVNNVPTWTPLVNNGTIENGGTDAIPLPSPFANGKVYFLIQSQDPSQPYDLEKLITSESFINWGSAALWDFRYDSFEVTLQNSPDDQGNLTSVNGFGLPMEVSIPYSNGTTATVGYGISGSTLVSDIQDINSSKTFTSTYTLGPLINDFRMAVAPATSVANNSPVANPPFLPADWASYVQSLEGSLAQNIVISGLFNGAADAGTTAFPKGVWHNGGYFAYQLQWDGSKGVFWLVPLASSQIKGYIELTPADLENSIYSTLGNAAIYANETDSTPFATINTGANNQWGKVLSEFLTGFTGGFYNQTGKPLNPQLTTTVNLDQNLNWDPVYAFQQNITGTPPSYQAFDPYSEIFYQNSNSYGSGYSDALMSQYAKGGPLISVSEPGQAQNVPDINLTLFADNETPTGYTPPVIYNYIAPETGGYAIPGTSTSGNTVVLNFAAHVQFNAGLVLADTDVLTMNILTSDTGNTPVWSTVTFDGSAAGQYGLWQNWQITYDSVHNTFVATSTGVAQPVGTLLIASFPTATNGVSWYQLAVGGKTYNLYTTTSGGAFDNPNYSGQQGSLAIDGLAQVVAPAVTTPTMTTFTVNLVNNDTVSFDPSLLVPNTTNIGSSIFPNPPNAPVAGTLGTGGAFDALPGQDNQITNTITTTAPDLAFAWTGDNIAPGTSLWVSGYTNKIDGLDVALVTLAPTSGAPITTEGTADVDGEWQTGTVDLAPGTYTVTMQEFLPTDTAFATPLTPASSALTLTEEPPCFCAGTRIATPTGDVPVEQLAIGDMVLTLRGEARPIVWFGTGRVLATRGRRSAATPVIVSKGALADNVPNRDLRITKGHALFLDGVLIPVEFLVNHRSIQWDDRAQEVQIYHIELANHDVLLANGAATESYRDDGNRWLFQNASTGWDQPAKPPCAPVLTGGPMVDALWQRLLERAGPRSAPPLTDDADLHLIVDGRRLDVAERAGDVSVFRLTSVPNATRIVSRSAVPSELGLARDARILGIALRRVTVRRGTRFRTIKANDARLSHGFHRFEPENGLRWTDGDAGLPEEIFAGFTPPLEVVVQLGATTRYLDEGHARYAA